MSRLGETGAFGNLAREAKPAEPAVGQIEMYFLDQAPLRADAVEIANQQHADHQFGIERRTAHVAVIRSKLPSHTA